ncbi:CHAT domain-containing protein [Paraburkholderia sediminicola]|uniref:CHAT domain-containing protein n=1 Tax=Paraburkholderia sediminicola TaxID=458836 RepID=UPI0038BBE0F0
MARTTVQRPILIVTGKDQTSTTISKSLWDLESAKKQYPELNYFLDRHQPMRLNTVEAAKELLSPGAGANITPVLIILDALVLQSTAPAARDGAAAVDFMEWLEKFHPAIPILVVAAASTENVERKVLARTNASLWRIEFSDLRNVLAEALAGIAPASPKVPRAWATRRITIDVGRDSARYRVSNGRYEFLSSSPISYERRSTLDRLIAKVEGFTPWPATGQLVPKERWYEDAIEDGQKLFDVLIRDTVGTHLIELLKHPPLAPETEPPKLDLRFEIDVSLSDYEKLFKLPFELVNDSDFDGVLCSRIPMARRIRINRGDLEDLQGTDTFADAGRALRILFMDANVSGNVRLQKSKSPVMTKSYTFAPLKTTTKELAILQNCAAIMGMEKMEPPEVVGRLDDGLVGESLREELRSRLISRRFDIFHFCGHSITLDDGLTYLIFPGEPDVPFAVSVRDVADWLRMGRCKMVVLSSCEGASALTAIETMRRGVEGMLGFRWKVEENLCVEYFQRFYESYLIGKQSFCESYRSACSQLQQSKDGSPAWASALAVLRD